MYASYTFGHGDKAVKVNKHTYTGDYAYRWLSHCVISTMLEKSDKRFSLRFKFHPTWRNSPCILNPLRRIATRLLFWNLLVCICKAKFSIVLVINTHDHAKRSSSHRYIQHSTARISVVRELALYHLLQLFWQLFKSIVVDRFQVKCGYELIMIIFISYISIYMHGYKTLFTIKV
jgi:hypothetical protein